MIESSAVQRAPQRDDVLDLAAMAEVGAFMSRVFSPIEDTLHCSDRRTDQRRGDIQAPAADPDQVDVLLGKASKAIEILAARCEILEQEATEKDELVAEHERSAKQWQQFAVKLQAQTANDQNTIAELTTRSDAANARIAALEAATDEARERSAAADANTNKLRSQVVTAFGRKSPVHSVLQAIDMQEAAE